jgi:hypothetical protein
MSSWLVTGLICVGLLAVGWAIENPLVSAQPDDKGKGKESVFRAGAVRYQVNYVDTSVKSYLISASLRPGCNRNENPWPTSLRWRHG